MVPDQTLILNPGRIVLDQVLIQTAAPTPHQVLLMGRMDQIHLKTQVMVPGMEMVENPRKIA